MPSHRAVTVMHLMPRAVYDALYPDGPYDGC